MDDKVEIFLRRIRAGDLRIKCLDDCEKIPNCEANQFFADSRHDFPTSPSVSCPNKLCLVEEKKKCLAKMIFNSSRRPGNQLSETAKMVAPKFRELLSHNLYASRLGKLVFFSHTRIGIIQGSAAHIYLRTREMNSPSHPLFPISKSPESTISQSRGPLGTIGSLSEQQSCHFLS